MKNLSAYAILFMLLSLSISRASSNDSLDSPIDVERALKTCLAASQSSSTINIVECYGSAYAAYDKLLNQTYKALMQTLDPASRDLLREAQRAWLESRRADNSLWTGPWLQKAGTVSRIEAAQSGVEAARSRLLQLEALQLAATPG